MENTETVTATLSERVAEEVRAMLARRRMSGRKLAEQLGVSPAWVSYRLTAAQPIDLNDLERIARVLNVEVTDLLPRINEGRVLPTAGDSSGDQRRGITIRKFRLTKRPRPNGRTKGTQPDPSTRRPGRVFAAHATS